MVNPVDQAMPSYWTLINTGGSINLANALLQLSPEAQENYLPLKAIKVSHQFSKDLAACGFYRNNSIQDATAAKQRNESRRLKKEIMMLGLKESLDKETREIAKLSRKLAMKQRQHRNQQMKKMKMLVCAIKNLQGVCRGWRGRNTAMRRRVIREAVRFVVRTSILFGAARASAELMEPHFAAQIIQKAWKRCLRKRRIKQIRGRRAKMGLKHKPGQFSRSDRIDDDDGCLSPKVIGNHKRIVGKWTPKSPNTNRYGGRGRVEDGITPLGGHNKRTGRKKKNKKEEARQHSYFRRGKRDSIVAFTKAAAMISKIHLASGGAWGVRDDEKVEEFVDKKVTDKMKVLAQSAAKRVKRKKSLVVDHENEEAEDAENYIRVKKKLHMIKIKSLQNVIISKSERPTTPPEDIKGKGQIRHDVSRWTIRLAPEQQEFLKKFEGKKSTILEDEETLRRPSSAGARPSKRAVAEVTELTKPALKEIIRRTTQVNPRQQRLSVKTNGLDALTEGRETESPHTHTPMSGAGTNSLHDDGESPIHFSPSPAHKANPGEEAFDHGSTILGSIMMGLDGVNLPKVPSRPEGLKSALQGSTPLRNRRVSAGDQSSRATGRQRQSRRSFNEIMKSDAGLIDFSAGMQRGLDMEMQRMADAEQKLDEQREREREQKEREQKEREREEEEDDSEDDEGGGHGHGFGSVVDDAVFVKEAEEVGLTVVLSPKNELKIQDEGGGSTGGGTGGGEEEEGYADDGFEEDEEEEGEEKKEEEKPEKPKVVAAPAMKDEDEDDYGDDDFEEFEQSESTDLP
ncbi:hypothetical protein TL16_g01141 [Triparma laevis f. inornata]|uniref:Uncharacterized protein n=1 Tax=Triparma laevis f. inornata TaxID=1714386 RepID=A0A9W7DR04_9STRA|nr:hypothetical protein TL16_g01141 [Triparma laevis f. inornata]